MPTTTRDAPGATRALGQPAALRLGALGLVVAALAALIIGVLVTGAVARAPMADPGALTRWGLPVAKAVSYLAASITIGLLVVVAFVLPSEGWPAEGADTAARSSRSDAEGRLGGPALAATRLAALIGAIWVASSVAVIVFSYARIAGVPPTAPGFGEQLTAFVTQLDLLRALLVSTVLTAVAATGAALATRHTTAGWMAGLALLALAPLALTGHAAGTRNHELAVDSLAAHLVGLTIWLGGLAALVLLSPRLGQHRAVAISRYSTLALWCFVAVAVSGLINAWLRLGSLAALGTSYGALVIAKSLALVLLGVAGWRHRSGLLKRADAGAPRVLGRLAVGELVIMSVALGLGVALSVSAPPVSDSAPTLVTAAESITGYPLPGAPTTLTWLTTWRLDLLWVAVVALLAGAYLVGVWRLTARGDRWPVLRTVPWLAGCLLLLWVTNGATGVYGRVLFSSHMLSHMTLSMVVPPLLVLGAPVTLALRTMTARRDGSRGPREWLLAIVHSRMLGVLGMPIVAAALFAVSLVVFYYSPLFELSLRTHTGHVLMHVHFLLTGYLFASVLIGIDPGPARPPYPLRLVVLFATMGFHAFFGMSLLQGTDLLAPGVLDSLGRTWGRTPLEDQRYGAGIAWGLGEFPTLMLGMAVALAWVRSDERDSKRTDRAADRDGDAELADYNARLADLARGRTAPR